VGSGTAAALEAVPISADPFVCTTSHTRAHPAPIAHHSLFLFTIIINSIPSFLPRSSLSSSLRSCIFPHIHISCLYFWPPVEPTDFLDSWVLCSGTSKSKVLLSPRPPNSLIHYYEAAIISAYDPVVCIAATSTPQAVTSDTSRPPCDRIPRHSLCDSLRRHNLPRQSAHSQHLFTASTQTKRAGSISAADDATLKERHFFVIC
jgi:hypothetical protein